MDQKVVTTTPTTSAWAANANRPFDSASKVRMV